jgi:hypothetical protein
VTWTNLLANKEAQKHKTSKKELDNMRALIARDLADAGVAGLSADRRFATAYNAALQAANMAIACAGYRIMSKVGHHRVSLESTKLVLGKPVYKYADYFSVASRTVSKPTAMKNKSCSGRRTIPCNRQERSRTGFERTTSPSAVVRDSTGKLLMESTFETKAATVPCRVESVEKSDNNKRQPFDLRGQLPSEA